MLHQLRLGLGHFVARRVIFRQPSQVTRGVVTSAALNQESTKMRLVQFVHNEEQRVGVEQGNGDIIDLNVDPTFPKDMVNFLKGGDTLLKKAKEIVTAAKSVHPKDSIKLISPITNPEKVLCIGMNYVDHCEEQNQPVPKEPVVFNKFASCIVGPTDDIIYPDETEQLDWEVELVIVIGKSGKNIKEEDAMSHIFGYTVAHDVSARDWQMLRNGKQWLLGKAMDTFCPLGPAIVTTDSLSDPHNLGLRCRVNGKTMQDSTTKNLVFKSEQLIAFVSRFMTLTPGDIILTGTPPGVGVFNKPEPIFLKRGDIVECEVDEIGTITNKIV